MFSGVIHRTDFFTRVRELAHTHRIIGPVARSEPSCTPPIRYFYESVTEPTQLALDFTYCVQGPKAVVLPPRETLLQFDRTAHTFRAAAKFDPTPTALIGVHPCDIHGIELLDCVFSQDIADEHYAARRRNLLIVGIDCLKPCTPSAFCADMETNAAATGFDVMLYPLPAADSGDPGCVDEYGVSFGTDTGRAWLAGGVLSAVRPATADDERRAAIYAAKKQASFPRRLSVNRSELAGVLEHSYDAPLWDETGQRCYSCGSCNLVCPTCYCFDVLDDPDVTGASATRERVWDGCMLHDFALAAGGHNFRPGAGQRLRHRIYRKAAWIEQRTGLRGCVGCARCDRACTAHISIVEILNQLTGEAEHAHD